MFPATASLRLTAHLAMLSIVVGIAAGLGSAIFLSGLYAATDFRETYPWLLAFLPVAGLGIGWLYDRYGQGIVGGTQRILARMRGSQDEPIPWTMAPAIVVSTILTHLFGGSAGREGTAVQMGGGLAETLATWMRVPPSERTVVLSSGIAGGFGAVFGTPLAASVFAIELISRGHETKYVAILPCLIAAFVGDRVCRALGITHHLYPVVPVQNLASAMAWAAIAGIGFGATSFAFVIANSAITAWANQRIATTWMRPFYGGLLVIGLTLAVGSHAYLGLSLPLIDRAFDPNGVAIGDFALKLLFTVITLGTGFKGGEVTPLFCIGATLGNTLASIFGQPHDLFAALGLVAVFAGAAKTPWASALLGVELFGVSLAPPLVIACLVSHFVSGGRGIYPTHDPSPAAIPSDTMRDDVVR